LLQTACGGLKLIADIQAGLDWRHAGASRGGRRLGLDRFGSGPGHRGARPDPDYGKEGGPPEPLTERQNRVPRLLRGPLSLPENAAELWLAPNTTKAHTQVIYPLGVSTEDDAITW